MKTRENKNFGYLNHLEKTIPGFKEEEAKE